MSKEFNKTAMLETIANYVDAGETLENIQYNAFNTDCWVSNIAFLLVNVK